MRSKIVSSRVMRGQTFIGLVAGVAGREKLLSVPGYALAGKLLDALVSATRKQFCSLTITAERFQRSSSL